MRNLYSKGEFLTLRKGDEMINEQMLNEGLFDFLSKMFNKVKASINKTKGGKEIEAIYQKYLDLIEKEFQKKIGVTLHLGGEDFIQQNKPNQQVGQQPNQPNQPNQQGKATNSSYSFLGSDKVYEAEAATDAPVEKPVAQVEQGKGGVGGDEKKPEEDQNVKLTTDALKKKQQAIQNIINFYQTKALKEMDLVLQKMGGAEKNPKLKTIIDNKKEQFRLDFLNAEIKALEAGGDKTTANKYAIERNKLAKDLDNRWNTLGKVENAVIDVDGAKFKIGVPYRFKDEKGVKTIIITKKSDKPGKVVAKYVSKEFGEITPQNFEVGNIDVGQDPTKGFLPKKGEYNYYSNNNKAIIKVMVTNPVPDAKGLIEVKAGDNAFKVYSGALIDIPKEKKKTEKPVTPAATQPAATQPAAQPIPTKQG
jgi:hypothetical protein